MEDRFYYRKLECYIEPEKELPRKNWENAYFDLSLLPTETMKEEFRRYIRYRGTQVALNTIRHDNIYFRQFCQAKRAETWSTFWLVLYPLLAYSIAAVLLLLCSGAVKGLPKRGGVGMNALFFAVGLLALVGGILWEPNLVHSISLVSLMEGECLFGLVCAARRKEK